MPNDDNANIYGNAVAPQHVRRARRMVRRYARKYRYDPDARYALSLRDTPVLGPALGVHSVAAAAGGAPLDAQQGVLIGTIRMGYGHYRIGIALASAARSMGLTPCWFDLLGFDSPGARLIRDLDGWYSFGSRLSQRSKLFNRFVWEPLTGNAYKRAEKNFPVMEVCRLFADVYSGLPRDMPLLGTHPWLALAGQHAGLTRIVNVVPDNCPLGFHLAPGTRHTVQSPSAYSRFRSFDGLAPAGPARRGIPAAELRVAGHYVDHELVVNVSDDCAARRARMANGEPRRLLVSIGGAGAQQDLLIDLLRAQLPALRAERAALLVNFGDHADAYARFRAALPEVFTTAMHHAAWADTGAFAEGLITGPCAGVHSFLHDDIFAAVYTTNVLMRGADVLITKPSELAFYPIPKLMLPRVGGHEAWGALRASELGDGTTECRDAATVAQVLQLLVEENDLLDLQCTSIEQQACIGTYDGAYRAVTWAREEATLG